jgi:hypothetical protein
MFFFWFGQFSPGAVLDHNVRHPDADPGARRIGSSGTPGVRLARADFSLNGGRMNAAAAPDARGLAVHAISRKAAPKALRFTDGAGRNRMVWSVGGIPPVPRRFAVVQPVARGDRVSAGGGAC